MSKRKRDSTDINILARAVVEAAIGEPLTPTPAKKKNPAAVALGRLGGLKGGKARARALSSKKRSQIAQLAASARWAKKKS